MSDQASELNRLKAEVDTLAQHLAVLEDINAVRTLHFTYGYLIDKCMYDEVVDLFSESGRVKFLNGVYKGKAGARRLYCDWFRNYFTRGINGPIYGFLLDHFLMQEIIHVAPDRKTAKCRARGLLLGGQHETKTDRIDGLPDAFLEGGIHVVTYVREEGVWKIGELDYSMLWQANYKEGVAESESHLAALTKTYPEDPRGPDEILPGDAPVWPNTRAVPFHYNHPVTGKPIKVPAPGVSARRKA